jgi:hypothetical protein
MKKNSHSELVDIRHGLPSASGIETLVLCKGKFQAEEGLPDLSWSEASEGTIRHALAEVEMPLDEIDSEERRFAIGRATECLEEIRAGVFGEAQAKCKLDGTPPPSMWVAWKEQRLWLKDSNGVPILSGQADYIEMVPKLGIGLIADYKMLYGEHSPAHKNPQLFTLAAILLQNHPTLKEIHIALIQPMLASPYSLSLLKPELIKEWAKRLFKLTKDIKKPDAKRTAGGKQCKYCRALPFCPTALQLMEDTMAKDIQDIAGDPDLLGEAYNRVPLFEKYGAALKKVVREKLKENIDSVSGYKLGKGRTLVSYDPDKALKALREKNFSEEDIDKLVKIQEGNLVRIWADKTGEPLAKAKKSLRAALADALETRSTQQRIIKEKE